LDNFNDVLNNFLRPASFSSSRSLCRSDPALRFKVLRGWNNM